MGEKNLISKALFSSNKDEWETPSDLFNELDEEFHFILDASCDSKNAKCPIGFNVDRNEDGLKESWMDRIKKTCNLSVFVNPPFSQKAKWIKKSYEESQKGCTVIMLIDARTDTKIWHEIIFPYASEIRFIKGRIKFIDENGNTGSAPFPSAIVIFKPPKKQTKLQYFTWRK